MQLPYRSGAPISGGVFAPKSVFIYLLLIFFIYPLHVLTPWSGRQVRTSGA